MNEIAEITPDEFHALWLDAQRYAYLKQWARHSRGYAWQLGVTLFSTAPTFDTAIDEAIQKESA